jgi:toxin-antitoxin system PIN domain toxin
MSVVMNVALLDVNVLIALFDPAHPNHEDAHTWLAVHGGKGWATSPTTINGCVRILSNPMYPSFRVRPDEVIERLREFCHTPNQHFWNDTIHLLDTSVIREELIGGHKNITDICLLALACRNNGRLVTFDRSISRRAVVGAGPEHLEVIGQPST